MSLTSEDLVAINQLMAATMQAQFSALRPSTADPLAYGPGTLTERADNGIGLIGGIVSQMLGLTHKTGPYAGTPLFRTSFRMQPYGQNSAFEESLMRNNAAMFRNIAGGAVQGQMAGFSGLFAPGSRIHRIINDQTENGYTFSDSFRNGLSAFHGFLRNNAWGQGLTQLGYGMVNQVLGYDRPAISQVAWQRSNYMAANQASIGGSMFTRNDAGRLVYNQINPYDQSVIGQRTTIAQGVSQAIDAAMYRGEYESTIDPKTGQKVYAIDKTTGRRIFRTSLVQDKSVTNGLDDATVAKLGTRLAAAGAFGDLGAYASRMRDLTAGRDRLSAEVEKEKGNVANLEAQYADRGARVGYEDPGTKSLEKKLMERRAALREANNKLGQINDQIDTEQENLNQKVKTNLTHLTKAVDSLRTVYGSADKAMSALDRYTGGKAFSDTSVAQRFARQMRAVDIAGFQAGVSTELQQNIMESIHAGALSGMGLSSRDIALGYGNTALNGYTTAAFSRNVIAAMGDESDPTKRMQIAAAGSFFAETFNNSDMKRVLVQLETGLKDGSISQQEAAELRQALMSGNSQLRAKAQRKLYGKMYNGDVRRGFRDLRNSSVMLDLEKGLSEEALQNIAETGMQSRINQNAYEFSRAQDSVALQNARGRLRDSGLRGKAIRNVEGRGKFEGAMAALGELDSDNARAAMGMLQSAYQKNLERFDGDAEKAMAATMRDYNRMGIADMLSDEERRAVEHGISSRATSALSKYADDTVLSGFSGSMAEDSALISSLTKSGAMRNGEMSRGNAMRAGNAAFKKLRRLRKISGIDSKTLSRARREYRKAVEAGDGAKARDILEGLMQGLDENTRRAVMSEVEAQGYGSGVGSVSSDEANALTTALKNMGVSGEVAKDAVLYGERFGAGTGTDVTGEVDEEVLKAREKLLSMPEQIVKYFEGNNDVELADILAANGDKDALEKAMSELLGIDKGGDIAAIARISNLNTLDTSKDSVKDSLREHYGVMFDGRKKGATAGGFDDYIEKIRAYTKNVADYGAGSEEAIKAFSELNDLETSELEATRKDLKEQIGGLGESEADKKKKEELKEKLKATEGRLKTAAATRKQFEKSYGRVRDVDDGRGSGGGGSSDLVTTMEDVMQKLGELITVIEQNREGAGL